MTSKVALVTGASRGIGAGIVCHLASEGFDIAFSYPHDVASAQDTIRQVEALGRRALAVHADGSTAEGNEKIVAEMVRVFGRLDVFVCNAGMYPKGTIDDITVGTIEAGLNFNVRGPMIETMCAVKHMKSGGRIVLMGSSFGGRAPLPGLVALFRYQGGPAWFCQRRGTGSGQPGNYDQCGRARTCQYSTEPLEYRSRSGSCQPCCNRRLWRDCRYHQYRLVPGQ